MPGQLALTLAGPLVSEDVTTQTRQALQNVEEILHAEGANLRMMVKMNIWLTDNDDFSAFNSVIKRAERLRHRAI